MNDRPLTPKRQPNCDELRDLIPAYGMGMADTDEIALIEANLADCPELQTELAEFQEIHSAMLLSVPQMTPPPGIKAALMEKTAPKAPSLPLTTPAPAPIVMQPQAPVRRINRWMYVAAACVALLLFTNVFWLTQNSAVQNELQASRDEVNTLNAQLNQPPQFLRELGTGQAQRVDLNPHEQQSDASLVWVPGQTADTWVGWFVSRELPPLTEGSVYQGWLIRKGDNPISIGVFTVDDASNGAFVFEIAEPIGSFDVVGVTIEPNGGSDQPTTDPVAVGDI